MPSGPSPLGFPELPEFDAPSYSFPEGGIVIAGKFIPYTESLNGDPVVKSLREFLDYEISRWFKDGEVVLKVPFEAFVSDIDVSGMNSKLAAKLGWNYAMAAKMAESDGFVFLLTAHPMFQAIPYSFRQVSENDTYAMHFVRQILSIRGGDIVFEEYDPEKHVAGCQYGGRCAVTDPSIVNAAFCDGGVRPLKEDMAKPLFVQLCRPGSGVIINMKSLGW